MNPIRWTYVVLLALLAGLWLAAEPGLWSAPNFAALRTAMVNGTGIVAVGAMAVALLLAARPAAVEPRLGGLDKMYRLHKWLGITALVMALLHWGWTQAPKWLVGLGWMAPRLRARAAPPEGTVLRWLNGLRGSAEQAGELAFYAAVLLIVLALVRWFPYRWFVKTHRLLAVLFLVFVFHAVVLMQPAYWSQPVAALMVLLMAAGSVAALRILLNRVGRSHRAVGTVAAVVFHSVSRVLQVTVQVQGPWQRPSTGAAPAKAPGGQFAFVTFDDREGAHPYTVIEDLPDSGRLTFLIKGLGDHTRALPAHLQVGQAVTLEGPYGQFDFSGSKGRQIWIGGGIGITPFISRMRRLAQRPDGKSVDLFHSAQAIDADALARLKADAAAANVRLHVLLDTRDGRLDAQRICDAVPAWRASDVWFCGPRSFGRALRQQFRARGLAGADFHQELFDMR